MRAAQTDASHTGRYEPYGQVRATQAIVAQRAVVARRAIVAQRVVVARQAFLGEMN